MLVHLVSRPLTPSDHIPVAAITLLARSLESAGARVIKDTPTLPGGDRKNVSALPTSDVAASVDACAGELTDRWREQRPDIVHTFGIVATLAAVKAAVDGPPIVATFDESPSHSEIESRVADQVAAVMPLSLEERDHWRRTGVRTLWTGPFPFTVTVPDANSGADADGDVVTMTTGQDLDATVASMPSWKGRLVVATRVAPSKVTALRARAQKLGVWDRITLRPALQGAEREEMWSQASALVAGRRGSRHGGQVLEAAAHGVPAVAVEAGANVDHVVSGTTGVLVPPNANARSLGKAVSSVVSNSFGLRAMGTSALVRVRALHSGALAARRLMAMYDEVLADERVQQGDAATAEASLAPSLRSAEERNTLVVENMALARQLAGWYSGRGQAMEDLVQVASLGLVKAAERFDPAFGKAFHSFAIPTILGELRKHFRDHAWAVRVPRGLQETTLHVQGAAADLSQSLGHEATTTELAEHLDLAEDEVLLALRAAREARSSHSLDHPIGEGGTVADLIGEIDPALESIELSQGVREALNRLPERERQILLLRFYGEQTQSQIAEQLGISQVQVSRVITRTLATLRDHVLNDAPLPTAWEQELVPPTESPRARQAS